MNNQNVNLDWKTVLALGVATVSVILALKLEPAAAERVLTVLASAQGGNRLALVADC